MSNSETSNESLPVPEELKALIHELKMEESDPKVKLLVWILNEFSQFKIDLQSSRASMTAVFDSRLGNLTQLLNVLNSIDEDLRQLLTEIKTQSVQLREKVERELAVPYKGLVQSYSELDKQAKGLLKTIEQKTRAIQLAFYAALVISGFMGGGVAGICLSHFLGGL